MCRCVAYRVTDATSSKHPSANEPVASKQSTAMSLTRVMIIIYYFMKNTKAGYAVGLSIHWYERCTFKEAGQPPYLPSLQKSSSSRYMLRWSPAPGRVLLQIQVAQLLLDFPDKVTGLLSKRWNWSPGRSLQCPCFPRTASVADGSSENSALNACASIVKETVKGTWSVAIYIAADDGALWPAFGNRPK